MSRSGILAGALVLALALPARSLEAAGGGVSPGTLDLSTPLTDLSRAPTVLSLTLEEPALGSSAAQRPEPPKNYWIPILEITGWNIIQNRWMYYTSNAREVYDVNLDTWGYNLTHWWWDSDGFDTNGFAHPYMGNIYFNLARSTGLNFWESAGYAFGGSLMWEYFGETEPPSYNDQVTTPWAGTIIGEILFRLSNRVLDGGGAKPGFWRELGALALNPFQGFNRILFGNKYRPPESLNDQPFFAEFRASVGLYSDAKEEAVERNPGNPVSLAIHLQNGVPGSDWKYRKPFDYYDLQFGLVANKNAVDAKGFMTLLMRGAVAAAQYGEGTSRGLWGLYFDYDYIAPSIYRVESCNLAFGATGQVDWGAWAMQYHTTLGLGFGAGGSATEPVGARDYHFGAQAAYALEGTFYYRDMLRFGVRARQYFTGTKVTDQSDAWEDVTYGTLTASWRFAGPHSIGVDGTTSRRRARYAGVPDIDSRISSVGVFYQLVSDPGMGRGG